MISKKLQIKTLGEWSVTLDGRSVATGGNQRAVLHALVLSGGEILREDLERVLPNGNLPRERCRQAVRNALSDLRSLGLAIAEHTDPVTMPRQQDVADVDLWTFLAHATAGRYAEAHAFVRYDEELRLLDREGRHDDLWRETITAFEDAKRTVQAAIEATAGRRATMAAAHERLLDRRLVPGVSRQVRIRDVRAALEPLPFPWRTLQGAELAPDEPLSGHVAALLAGADAGGPRHVILTGPPGAGKTLTAISTFLRLTDRVVQQGEDAVRTVLYADARVDAGDPLWGTDTWFERVLRDAGGVGHGRPIVILPHADAFLARHQDRLYELLAGRLFRANDVLLCCGERFYDKRLCYEDYGTDVLALEPWDVALQSVFARAVFGDSARARFEAWRDDGSDDMRGALCAVPLNLVAVLSLLEGDPDGASGISTAHELFDRIARTRLRVAQQGDEDELLAELAALAHRFHVTSTPDRPIELTTEELREHLRTRSPHDVERRADALINHMLLTAPSGHADKLCFEEPAWGRYFVARHLVQTLSYRPAEATQAFAKLFSADVVELCEELLQEALGHHEEGILDALRAVFGGAAVGAGGLGTGRLALAREQVAALLGGLGSARIRAELAALVQRSSVGAARDPLVRHGLFVGLASGGQLGYADRYVAELRAERAGSGPARGRDANVGFLLSFHGDQPFDPDRPAAIGARPDPVRTVDELLYGLEGGRHVGRERIDLFTLIDLGVHPAIPRECFERAIEPHLERLQTVLERLAGDPLRRRWPELSEARELLEPRRSAA